MTRSMAVARGFGLGIFFLVIVAVPVAELLGGAWPGRGVSAIGWRDLVKGKVAEAVGKELEQRSVVAERVRPFYHRWMFRLFRATTPFVVVGRDHWLFLASTVRGYPPPDADRMVEESAALIRSTLEWFEAQGTRVFMLVVPNKASVYPEKLADVRPPFRPAYDRSMAILEQADIWTENVRPLLDPREYQSYFASDTHWTPEGALRVAERVAEILRQDSGGILPGPELATEIRREPPRIFEGELYLNLDLGDAPDLARLFEESAGRIYGAAAASGEALSTEERADLVVAGTSFSKGFELATLLSALLQRPVEDTSAAGATPSRSLLAIAEDVSAGRRAPPAYVVWEFPERYLFLSVAQLREPLRQFLRSLELDLGARGPLAVAARTQERAVVEEQPDGSLRVRPDPQDAELTFTLAEPVPGDGSLALAFTLTTEKATGADVFLDAGSGFDETPRFNWIPRKQGPQEVFQQLETPARLPVQRIRIRLRGKAEFLLSRLEVVPARR